MNNTTTTTSSIIALDIIPDLENNQVFFFQQKPVEDVISHVADVQVVKIDEDELDLELGLDFGDYYDTDYDDEYEQEEDEDYEDEIIQQFQTVDIDPCPGA
jgi:hypothetical protein